MTIRTDELKTLTKKFALRIIKVSRALPRCPEPRVIGFDFEYMAYVGAQWSLVLRIGA